MGHEHESECGSQDCSARPQEPDHPMMLDGDVVPGDTALMLRCLFEEFLRNGSTPAELASMCANDEFQALAAARHVLGIERVESILREAAGAVGVQRFVEREVLPCFECGESNPFRSEPSARERGV